MGKPEAIVEAYLKKRVEVLGGEAYKFASPARRSVPDKICVFPTGIVAFVECKTLSGSMSKGQIRECARLSDLNQIVVVVHSKEEVDAFLVIIKQLIAKSHKQAEEKANGKL